MTRLKWFMHTHHVNRRTAREWLHREERYVKFANRMRESGVYHTWVDLRAKFIECWSGPAKEK